MFEQSLHDNCPMFDVETYLAKEINSTDNRDKQKIGCKIIGGLAENIKYVHSLENNNVILRFSLEDNEQE